MDWQHMRCGSFAPIRCQSKPPRNAICRFCAPAELGSTFGYCALRGAKNGSCGPTVTVWVLVMVLGAPVLVAVGVTVTVLGAGVSVAVGVTVTVAPAFPCSRLPSPCRRQMVQGFR